MSGALWFVTGVVVTGIVGYGMFVWSFRNVMR